MRLGFANIGGAKPKGGPRWPVIHREADKRLADQGGVGVVQPFEKLEDIVPGGSAPISGMCCQAIRGAWDQLASHQCCGPV
jgi:hypothetical protein